jgi:hypothetical protein
MASCKATGSSGDTVDSGEIDRHPLATIIFDFVARCSLRVLVRARVASANEVGSSRAAKWTKKEILAEFTYVDDLGGEKVVRQNLLEIDFLTDICTLMNGNVRIERLTGGAARHQERLQSIVVVEESRDRWKTLAVLGAMQGDLIHISSPWTCWACLLS